MPLILALLLTLAGGCTRRGQLHDEPIKLATADGITLAAHQYVPAQENPPGLILVHRAGGDRALWTGFAVRAQQWGYLVIALDLRGHGESLGGAGTTLDHRKFGDDTWGRMDLDLDAAVQALIALGANPRDLFIAGEGFGANLALRYTLDRRDIQGVVLLSPGTAYHGIESAPLMEQLRTRPALIIWSERDEYAAATAATLQRRAAGHLEARAYPGTAHGADIFTSAPESMGQVLVWLDQMREKPRSSGISSTPPE